MNRVQYRGDRVIIEKRGTPAAALVSIEDLETLKSEDRPGRILRCAGLFADVPELEGVIKEVVASRSMSRKVRIR